MKIMKTLTIGGNTYEIYDEKARSDIEALKKSGTGGSGGSGGGVSSWNDLTDKPFYEETSFTKLYENENLAFTQESGTTRLAYIIERIDFVAGETYRINWDGTEYSTVCVDMGNFGSNTKFLALGNLALGDPSYENTGEPFVISCMYNTSTDQFACSVSITTTEKSHSIAIYGNDNVVHTIDEKFIPNTVARKSDVTWENLPDKPFSGSRTVIEWGGDTYFGDSFSLDDTTYYKISSIAPLKDELIGVIIEYSNGSIVELDSDSLVEGYGCYRIDTMIVVHRGDATLDGVELNAMSPGCYATNIDGLYISKFKYGIVTHIDEKYIPDTIARVEDVSKNLIVDLTLGDYDEEYFVYRCTANCEPDDVVDAIDNGFNVVVQVETDHGVDRLPFVNCSGNGANYYFTHVNGDHCTVCHATLDTRTSEWYYNSYDLFPPQISPVSDATGENVTAAEFNALLAAMREAGYLAT